MKGEEIVFSKMYTIMTSKACIFLCFIPCFPENKTGLILIFTLKYYTRAYLAGSIFTYE